MSGELPPGLFARVRRRHPLRFAIGCVLALACVGVVVWAFANPEQLPARGPGGGRGKNHLAMLALVIGPIATAVYWGIVLRIENDQR